ncbi:hypothetical protein ACK32U_22340 [Aeromonas dhakensis]|uniref:hypothetical protein n=1 Tax=Aeromonas dhakensis TaxID=196024 RepID=UPI003988A739
MFAPLSGWIKRTQPISERFYTPGIADQPNSEWGVWISIEESTLLHDVQNMKWTSLKESRAKTQEYISEASDLINGLEGGWLDREEQSMILEELGLPPNPSLPVYIITCKDKNEENESVVYIGKTKNQSRFGGGHQAALKLHHPKYDNKEKRIYRATIWFRFNNEYVNIDWIQPESLSLDLLDSLESHLIYNLQPELNIHKKKTNLCKWDFYVHIQNFLENNILDDEMF